MPVSTPRIETRDRNSSAPRMPPTSSTRLPATTSNPNADGLIGFAANSARRSQAKYSGKRHDEEAVRVVIVGVPGEDETPQHVPVHDRDRDRHSTKGCEIFLVSDRQRQSLFSIQIMC